MFTGIIQTIAQVTESQYHSKNMHLTVKLKMLRKKVFQVGDSIAVNGCCLTVVAIHKKKLSFELSHETLKRTNFRKLKIGDWTNIEFSMLATTPFNGHFVSGHVDALAETMKIKPIGKSHELSFKVPTTLQKYITPNGCICIDGVSLTINSVKKNIFSVTIIPHTWDNTIIQFYKVGARVNIEIDLIARYVELLLTNKK